MLFTDVGYNCYIQTEKVKYVITFGDNKASSDFVKKAEESLKLLNTTLKKATLTLVVLEDNTVLRSPISAEKIVERLSGNGHKLIQVETGYYISVYHIKAFMERDSILAVNLRKVNVKAGDDLLFIRQRNKINSTILMTTGETVSLSKYTKDLVDIANNLDV